MSKIEMIEREVARRKALGHTEIQVTWIKTYAPDHRAGDALVRMPVVTSRSP